MQLKRKELHRLSFQHGNKAGALKFAALGPDKQRALWGGDRVPFIVRWPKVVTPGSVCGPYVHQLDLMSTFADILGTRLPGNVSEDSVSLLPLLEGRNEPVRQKNDTQVSW